MQTAPAAIAPLDEDAAAGTYSAYQIGCGPWQLAVDAQWTTNLLDNYGLQPIPRAPQWLAGCTNVDGILVPVIDLLLLLDPATASARGVGQKLRLLLGSHSPGDNEEAIGLLFTGLPRLLTFARTALPANLQAPPLLCQMARGLALAPDGQAAIALDTRHVIDHCISQLDAFNRASA
jgi:chemotaxis signal transduction protein